MTTTLTGGQDLNKPIFDLLLFLLFLFLSSFGMKILAHAFRHCLPLVKTALNLHKT